jgi:hypothetical protein
MECELIFVASAFFLLFAPRCRSFGCCTSVSTRRSYSTIRLLCRVRCLRSSSRSLWLKHSASPPYLPSPGLLPTVQHLHIPARHQTHYPQQCVGRQHCRRMAWKREGANIAAQVIQRRSRSQGIRQLKELDERGFRPVSHPARLVLGQRFERLLEAVEFEGREAFLGEDVGEAEGELLFISSHLHQDFSSHEILLYEFAYLEREGRRPLNCPDP